MSMWTHKARRHGGSGCKPYESDWEAEERRERMRHAVWLVLHGAPMAEVGREFGVGCDTLRYWVKRAEVAR